MNAYDVFLVQANYTKTSSKRSYHAQSQPLRSPPSSNHSPSQPLKNAKFNRN